MKNRIASAVGIVVIALVALTASAQNQLWIRQFGSSVSDYQQAVAPDGSGGVYIGGYTGGNLGGPIAGGSDAWLAHYDSAGNRTWIRQFGSSDGDILRGAAPDGLGGVYVSGNTYGSLGGQSAGGSDAWLANYDSGGNQLWIRQIGTSGTDDALTAAPDGSGGVYVGGYTQGSLGGPGAGSNDAWLAHYDSAGNQTWIRQLGTSGADYAFAVAPDGSGGLAVGGYTRGSLGGPSAGGNDAWFAHYDNAGNQTWIRQFGSSSDDFAVAAAPDGSGGVCICGYTGGNIGGPSAGGNDAWLAHLDNAGNRTWIRQFGSSSDDFAVAAAPDGSGGVYVSGNTHGSLGGPIAGGSDAWIARYDVGCGATTYCTAKLNSVGCTPSIGWTGTATATGPIDDFFVTASNVLNRKPGLMIWSTLPGSIPLGGGTLCLSPPVIRTFGQASGGSLAPTIDRTGQYSFHFDHAYIQSYFLAAGQTIRAQYWSRDPGSGPPHTAYNIGLTNALSFVICP